MVTDSISDLLTRVRNAQRAGHPSVTVPASRKKERVLQVLIDEGFIAGIEKTVTDGEKPAIKIFLRYSDTGQPVIREITRMSSPGRRIYVEKDNIPYCRGGLGTVIVSTSKGVMPDREARKLGVGGELVCSVF